MPMHLRGDADPRVPAPHDLAAQVGVVGRGVEAAAHVEPLDDDRAVERGRAGGAGAPRCGCGTSAVGPSVSRKRPSVGSGPADVYEVAVPDAAYSASTQPDVGTAGPVRRRREVDAVAAGERSADPGRRARPDASTAAVGAGGRRVLRRRRGLRVGSRGARADERPRRARRRRAVAPSRDVLDGDLLRPGVVGLAVRAAGHLVDRRSRGAGALNAERLALHRS